MSRSGETFWDILRRVEAEAEGEKSKKVSEEGFDPEARNREENQEIDQKLVERALKLEHDSEEAPIDVRGQAETRKKQEKQKLEKVSKERQPDYI